MSTNEVEVGADEKAEKADAKSLLADVADRIKGSGSRVYELLVEQQVTEEVTRRVDLLKKALVQRTDAVKALEKVNKPDVEGFDAEGKPTVSHYSKARLEEIKKAREAVEKVEVAISKALEGDMAKLDKLLKPS